MARLLSPVMELSDFWQWYELALERGWTDGLVVAPPTEERVTGIVDYLQRSPSEVLGVVGPQERDAGEGVAHVSRVRRWQTAALGGYTHRGEPESASDGPTR